MSDREIARTLGMREQSVRRYRLDPAFRTRLDAGIAASHVQTADTPGALLTRGALRAAQRLMELCESERPAVALRAAIAVLDRTGFGIRSEIALGGDRLDGLAGLMQSLIDSGELDGGPPPGGVGPCAPCSRGSAA